MSADAHDGDGSPRMSGPQETAARLALGLAALGRPAYINVGRVAELPADRTVEAMRSAAWEVLDAAYAGGIRWMDAARSYGRAEEFLAGWLESRGHRDVTVSSKWGYAYVGGWRIDVPTHEVKEHSLRQFRVQLAQSRRWLGDRLSLYQVHSLTDDSPLFTDDALLRALAETAAQGIRIGFSTSGAPQGETMRRAFELEVAGRRLFTAVQATWNLFEQSAAGALAEAHAGGALVMLKETLANGRLVAEPPPAVRQLAARYGAGPDAVALAAALSQPWADRVLIGPVSPAQVRGNLAAAQVKLDDADLAELAGVAVAPGRYWAERAALPWT